MTVRKYWNREYVSFMLKNIRIYKDNSLSELSDKLAK